MASYLDNLQAGTLQLVHYALHGAHGEDTPLLLEKHSEAGGSLTELLSLAPGQFTVTEVQPEFDGYQDGATAVQRNITVLGSALTPAIIAALQTCQWQGTRYKLEVRQAPESLRRTWHFLATPVEAI